MQNFQGMIFKWIRHLQNFDGKRRGILRIYWVAILTRRPSYQLYFSSFDWSSLDFLLMTSPTAVTCLENVRQLDIRRSKKVGFQLQITRIARALSDLLRFSFFICQIWWFKLVVFSSYLWQYHYYNLC